MRKSTRFYINIIKGSKNACIRVRKINYRKNSKNRACFVFRQNGTAFAFFNKKGQFDKKRQKSPNFSQNNIERRKTVENRLIL